MSTAAELVARYARVVPDFPAPGIVFRDLTPVLADAVALRVIVDEIVAVAADADVVAGIDARGFLIAAPVAVAVGAGVLAVRKGGKLPPPVLGEDYALEYGAARIEIPGDGLDLVGKRILVVDDVLATGGTARAAIRLIERAGAIVAGTAFIAELPGLGGREALAGYPVTTLVAD